MSALPRQVDAEPVANPEHASERRSSDVPADLIGSMLWRRVLRLD